MLLQEKIFQLALKRTFSLACMIVIKYWHVLMTKLSKKFCLTHGELEQGCENGKEKYRSGSL